MPNKIQIKRSSVAGKIPTTSDLDAGELGINTYDGKLYLKRTVSGTSDIIEVGATGVVQQTDIGTGPDEVPLNGFLGALAYKNALGIMATETVAPTLASAATIQPMTPIAFVSGTTNISTIIAPPEMTGGGQITLIPTGLWSTITSGNIALATTAVVSKALVMTYDAGTAKWYPSY